MGALEGRVAIITGAGRGIGREHALLFAAEGAKVVVNDLGGANDGIGTDITPAQQVVDEIRAMGGEAVVNGDNVADWEGAQRMVNAAIEAFGDLDILVNNAGILRDKTLRKMAADDWQAVIDTNLTGVFNGCRAACDRISDGGRIVNISSISAAVGFYGQANYAAAKAGVVGLTKVVSRELAKRAITVNAVAPGVVLTDMGRTIPAESLDAMLEEIPLRRFGEPREIAEAILFLVSPMASYVTGQTLHVNGGWWG
jgi:3-oxoacyl-[acyl-carrier protein] reductase